MVRFKTYKDLDDEYRYKNKYKYQKNTQKMPKCQGLTKRGTPCSLTTPSKDCASWCHLHRPREDCSICLDSISPSTIHHIGCDGKHVFHKACINTWFLDHDSCPMCRAEVANPLPIILPRLPVPVLPPPPPEFFQSIAAFVRLSLQDDPTMRVSLYFDMETGAMDDAVFWNSRIDDDSNVIAYIFIDGVQRCVLYRWW